MSVRDLEHKQGASNELRESERRFSEMLSNVALISMMLDRQANDPRTTQRVYRRKPAEHVLVSKYWTRAAILNTDDYERGRK